MPDPKTLLQQAQEVKDRLSYDPAKADPIDGSSADAFIKRSEASSYDNRFSRETRDVNTRFDLSNRDYLSGYENPLTQDLDELRAQRQSWGKKASTGVARVGVKILGEVAKMPGIVGGSLAAVAAPEGKGWETAVDNWWIRAVNNLQEDINEDVLPVYVKKAVKEGNLWENITAVDFWATEGADGIGFIASMLVPGAAIAKIGVGAKIMAGIGKTSKAFGKLDDVANMLQKFKINPKNIDTFSQATANTLFEAAAEAKGAGDRFDQEMKEKLDNKEITLGDYNKGRAEAMRNVFVANAMILLGPNAIMAKMIYGKKAASVGAKGAAKEAVKKTIRSRAAHLGQDVGKATLREGFFEEGLQSTVEELAVSRGVAGESITDFGSMEEAFSEIPEAYLDMLQTVDGQKAIFLGGFLGGGMQAYSGKKERAYENRSDKQILNQLENVDSFFKLYSADVYNMETGEVSASKMVDKLQAIAGMEEISALYDKAAQSGNQVQTDAIRAWAMGEMTKGFIAQGDKGIASLEEYLKASDPISDIAGLEKKDKAEVTSGILNRAKKLQGDFALFQEFAPSFMNMENDKATQEDIDSFYDLLNYDYVGKKNMLYHYEDQLAKAKSKKGDVLKRFKLQSDLVSDDQRLVTAAKSNPVIQKISDEVKMFEDRISDLEGELNKYWDTATHQTHFNKKVEQHDAMKKQQEEDRLKEVEDTVAQIKNATLDNIEEIIIPEGPAAKQLRKQLKEKRKNLEKGIEEAQEEATQEQQDDTQADEETKDLNQEKVKDLGNWLANNTNVDEPVSITEEESTLYGRSKEGDDLYIAEINDKEVVVVNLNPEGTEKYAIPRGIVTDTAPAHDPIQDYNTEGSDLHDEHTPIDNENQGSSDPKISGTGSKLISWNKKLNKAFDFVSKAFREYESNPVSKKGNTVGFSLNEDPGDGVEVNKALAAYKNGDFSDMALLIDYLPINGVFAPGVEAPMETKPSTDGSVIVFNGSSRVLRTGIINALKEGGTFEDLSTTIEGQYGGMLAVDSKKEDGTTRKNSILDLHFLKGLSKKDKLELLRNKIGVVRGTGDIKLLDGKTTIALNKPKAKGEIFLMIPMTNGKEFPLNLNISFIQEGHADLLFDLYNLRVNDPTISKDTVLSDLKDKEFVKNFKAGFKKEIALIGRGKDTTVRDVTDFMLWDGTQSASRKIGFGGTGVKGERQFTYGNIQANGNVVGPGGQLSKEAFVDWLTTTKRYNITTAAHANQLSKANIKGSVKYLEYLIDSKVLNTNAVVGESTPTFQGYTTIYMNSNGLVNKNAPTPEVLKEKSTAQKAKEKKERQVEFNRLRKDPNFDMVQAATEADRIVSERYNAALPLTNDEVSSETLEKSTENIRNSHKDFVSLQDVNNTEEANKATEMKDEAKSTTDLSEKLMTERLPILMTYVITNRLIRIGVQTNALNKKSVKEQYKALEAMVKKNDDTVENAILKCKK